jgi:hypothetical protein
MLAHCYVSHCTPRPSPYAYKRKVQGPLIEGWPRGEGRDSACIGLSLPPAWTLVTPYCKRTRPGRGTNTKAAGFPFYAYLPPAFSPLRAPSRADPSGLGHAATIYSSVQGPPPGVETPIDTLARFPFLNNADRWRTHFNWLKHYLQYIMCSMYPS